MISGGWLSVRVHDHWHISGSYILRTVQYIISNAITRHISQYASHKRNRATIIRTKADTCPVDMYICTLTFTISHPHPHRSRSASSRTQTNPLEMDIYHESREASAKVSIKSPINHTYTPPPPTKKTAGASPHCTPQYPTFSM